MRRQLPWHKLSFVVLASAAAVTSGIAHTGPAHLAGAHSSATCSASPNPAAVGQLFTVSASGLPTGSTVNRIETVPDGTTETSWITVNKDGTFSETTGDWNNEAGTYTFQFVGKATWPAGTFKTSYAACSAVVS